MTQRREIAVLGGGAWGTALAITMCKAGHGVRLWARDAAAIRAIVSRRESPRYLPGIPIDPAIRATADSAEALRDADCVLVVVPAQSLREVLTQAAPHIGKEAHIVLCAKGIEAASGSLLSAVVAGILPASNSVAVLSGPSFAYDVARELPTAVVVAEPDTDRARLLASQLSTPNFRCYSTDDRAGVEVGGALKNVIAIAAGAVIGAGLGASAQAALVTRGFVELRRIAVSFGARPETLMGLSGLGDLLLTCASPQSRNFAYGVALGHGKSPEKPSLVEGVATTEIAFRIARERGIETPIISATRGLLQGAITVEEAVDGLMSRPLRSEDE